MIFFFQTIPVKYKTELCETLEVEEAPGSANFCSFFFRSQVGPGVVQPLQWLLYSFQRPRNRGYIGWDTGSLPQNSHTRGLSRYGYYYTELIPLNCDVVMTPRSLVRG